mmetsp:Transcript_35860/g.107797  ORF Transcript_35860/g.107797 Transcript_35860/m.107797 type:complete len:213 (+) Transcript_35860:108-746(+)
MHGEEPSAPGPAAAAATADARARAVVLAQVLVGGEPAGRAVGRGHGNAHTTQAHRGGTDGATRGHRDGRDAREAAADRGVVRGHRVVVVRRIVGRDVQLLEPRELDRQLARVGVDALSVEGVPGRRRRGHIAVLHQRVGEPGLDKGGDADDVPVLPEDLVERVQVERVQLVRDGGSEHLAGPRGRRPAPAVVRHGARDRLVLRVLHPHPVAP